MAIYTPQADNSGWFRFQILVPALLIGLMIPFTVAVSATVSDFAGDWVETRPESGPPMRLRLTPHGSQIDVRISYNGTFGSDVDGVATFYNNKPTWTVREHCRGPNRKPGYNYDEETVESVYTLNLGHAIDGPSRGPVLFYNQETKFYAPCDGHPIGTERSRRVLLRPGR